VQIVLTSEIVLGLGKAFHLDCSVIDVVLSADKISHLVKSLHWLVRLDVNG